MDSGWLPRNFWLSLAIKRATPSRISKCAREEPSFVVELDVRSFRQLDPKIAFRPRSCPAPMCLLVRFVWDIFDIHLSCVSLRIAEYSCAPEEEALRPALWKWSAFEPPNDDSERVVISPIGSRPCDAKALTDLTPPRPFGPHPHEPGIIHFKPAQPQQRRLSTGDGVGARWWSAHV